MTKSYMRTSFPTFQPINLSKIQSFLFVLRKFAENEISGTTRHGLMLRSSASAHSPANSNYLRNGERYSPIFGIWQLEKNEILDISTRRWKPPCSLHGRLGYLYFTTTKLDSQIGFFPGDHRIQFIKFLCISDIYPASLYYYYYYDPKHKKVLYLQAPSVILKCGQGISSGSQAVSSSVNRLT